MKSIQNAREFGGYRSVDGRIIKSGLLLRTASLHRASDKDIQVLTDTYRLQHIVDLRMDFEISGAEDPVIDGAAYHHFDVIDADAMGYDGLASIDMTKLDIMQLIELSVNSGILNEKMYIGFLENDKGKKAFSDFFHVLLNADPDRAVLWHCTGGKDRTGLAAMLLLFALEVPEDVIIADYLLTNDYYAERIEGTKQLLQSKGCSDSFIEKALLVLDAVDERFMRSAVEYLKQTYGSVIGYIRDGLNITQNNIDSLKEKYLE